MRILVLHAHPVEASYSRALARKVCESLAIAGHEVDYCNLYAEGFSPVLSEADRLAYHDVPQNRSAVQPYVDRLMRAEGLVIVSPVWHFGFPAMLKGFFDRVFLPGVSFELTDQGLRYTLRHIRKLGAVMTYGAQRWRAMAVGDPPRRIVKRVLRAQIHPISKVVYLAHHGIDTSTDESRAAFLDKVGQTMARF